MNAFTKMSDKGQVVVPKGLRDLKGCSAGTSLEAVDVVEGVLLRPRSAKKKGLTVEEAVARLRQIYRHSGPPIPTDQLGWTIVPDEQTS